MGRTTTGASRNIAGTTRRDLSASLIWSRARIGTDSARDFHAEISRELVDELPIGVGKPTEVPKSLTWELPNRLQHAGKYEGVELLADSVSTPEPGLP